MKTKILMTRREAIVLSAGAAAAVSASAQPAPFTLPKLPYAVDALEPYIDARTMEIHHGKHHQAYVDNLNKALSGQTRLAGWSLDELLRRIGEVPESIRTAVRNHGGGHANHSLFWQLLAPPRQSGPSAALQKAIEAAFGSRNALEDKLKAAGMQVFGSGWAWLSLDAQNRLIVHGLPNQDSPLMENRRPLLGIDVWEHAYYLKYQNRRADYLDAVMRLINWDFVSDRFERLRA